MNDLAKIAAPSLATLQEQLEILRQLVQRALPIAQQRNRTDVDVFQRLIDKIERTEIAIQLVLDASDDSTLRYPDDCRRIQTVLRVYCDEHRTLRECEKLWISHSDGTAANWMNLPADDEELAACVSTSFSSNDIAVPYR